MDLVHHLTGDAGIPQSLGCPSCGRKSMHADIDDKVRQKQYNDCRKAHLRCSYLGCSYRHTKTCSGCCRGLTDQQVVNACKAGASGTLEFANQASQRLWRTGSRNRRYILELRQESWCRAMILSAGSTRGWRSPAATKYYPSMNA
jgi:hypothetical protein